MSNRKRSKKSQFTIEMKPAIIIFLFAAAILFALMFVVVLLTYLGIHVIGTADLEAVLLTGLLLALAICILFAYSMWRIDVNCNEIEYRNYLGRIKHYTFNDLTEIKVLSRYRLCGGDLAVYSNRKKVFSIPYYTPEYMQDRFLNYARKKGVAITHQS